MKKLSLLILLGGAVISAGIFSGVAKADFISNYISGPEGWGTDVHGDFTQPAGQIDFRAQNVYMKIDYGARAVIQATGEILNSGDSVLVGSRITFSALDFQSAGNSDNLTWKGRINWNTYNANLGGVNNVDWKNGYFSNGAPSYKACNLSDQVYICNESDPRNCPARLADEYVYPFMSFFENGKYLSNQIPKIDAVAAQASGVLTNCVTGTGTLTCTVAKAGNINVNVVFKSLKIKLAATNHDVGSATCEYGYFYPKAVSSPEVDEIIPPAKTVVINLVAQAPLPPVPVCNNASITVPKDSAGQLVVLNCSGTIDSRAIVAQPQHGTLNAVNQTNGTVTYTPTAGYTGSDSFTFKATNAGGDSNVATISITIPTPPPAGDPPVCTNGSVSVPKDSTGQSVDLSCSGGVISTKTAPQHGTLSAIDQTAKTVVYKPTAGYAGTDSFTFGSTDANGDSNVATISITVVAPPPVITIPAPTIKKLTAGNLTIDIAGTFEAQSAAVAGAGNQYRYQFDWDGDEVGPFGTPTGFVNAGDPGQDFMTWISPGDYKVKARTMDNTGRVSAWSTPLDVVVGTPPPACTEETTFWTGCSATCGPATKNHIRIAPDTNCLPVVTETQNCSLPACDSEIIEVPVGGP